MMSHICTFNIGDPVAVGHVIFIIVTTAVLINIAYHKIGFMTFLHQVIASSSNARLVTTNLPFLTNYFLHKSVSLVSKIFVTELLHT